MQVVPNSTLHDLLNALCFMFHVKVSLLKIEGNNSRLLKHANVSQVIILPEWETRMKSTILLLTSTHDVNWMQINSIFYAY